MRRKKYKKKKLKFSNIIVFIIMIICFCLLCVSITNIYDWKIDSDKILDITDKIDKVTNISDVVDNEDTLIIEQEEEIDEFNPYFDYIKMNLIEVDFDELKEINKNTKGWIQVNGTNVNYPFVQGKDNEYYLTHSFDNSYNKAGWVYIDYRNNINNMDRNTLIYAHGRYDNTMFGSLRNILNNGWLKNSDNFVIKMSSLHENSLWQVFSVYRIPTTNDYLKINFLDNEEFLNFSNMLITRSDYDFNTSVYENDKILTLSTCYNDDDKLVVHAKLIKVEKRNN